MNIRLVCWHWNALNQEQACCQPCKHIVILVDDFNRWFQLGLHNRSKSHARSHTTSHYHSSMNWAGPQILLKYVRQVGGFRTYGRYNADTMSELTILRIKCRNIWYAWYAMHISGSSIDLLTYFQDVCQMACQIRGQKTSQNAQSQKWGQAYIFEEIVRWEIRIIMSECTYTISTTKRVNTCLIPSPVSWRIQARNGPVHQFL